MTTTSVSPLRRDHNQSRWVWLALAVFITFLCVVLPGCDPQTRSGIAGTEGPFPGAALTVARELARQLWADPTVGIGVIRIPRIGLELRVGEGVEPEDLEKGPGHWPETPLPGQKGRVVISAHRVSWGGPFRLIDELQPGDRIQLVLPYGTAEYEVTEKLVVGPRDVQVVAQRGQEELSLTTCHPIGSADQRLVIQARAVSFDPLARLAPASAGASTP